MVSSCKDARDAVALCLQRSECVMLHRHTPKECYENPELNKTLPQPCYVHILRYIDCKRGQADRSRRLRGNGPLSTGKYKEDLEKLEKGDFDASRELHKLAATEPVTSKAQALAEAKTTAKPTDEPKKSWWPF